MHGFSPYAPPHGMSRRIALIAIAWVLPVAALLTLAALRPDMRTGFILGALTFGLGWGIGLGSGWWMHEPF